jgi:hypothetical protein
MDMVPNPLNELISFAARKNDGIAVCGLDQHVLETYEKLLKFSPASTERSFRLTYAAVRMEYQEDEKKYPPLSAGSSNHGMKVMNLFAHSTNCFILGVSV